MLELILQGFGALALFGTGLVIIFAGLQARHERPAPPKPTPRVGVKLTLHECSHCQRAQLWSPRFGLLTCICGGVYRDAWQEPRVLREAAEIVEKLA